MKVKKNDTVLVLTGKDNGTIGKVLSAHPSENRVTVEGVNVQKRSKKARSPKETSQIVEQFGPINVSNVMVVCPTCGKATRVGYTITDGKKVRTCKKCGSSLEVKETKTAKKAVKKATEKKTTEKKTAEKKTTTRKKKADAE